MAAPVIVLLIVSALCSSALSKQVSDSRKKSDVDFDSYHPSPPDDGVSANGDFLGSGIVFDWHELAQKEIERALDVIRNQRETPAKNVILFIGDGMGVSTVTAARVHHAQSRRLEGEDVLLAWDKFDHVGLSMTYGTQRLVAESAGTATALICGEKVGNGVVCVNQFVSRGNCSAMEGNELKSIIHKAVEAGKSTGVVTTTGICDATPSTTFAHAADRNWKAVAPDGCRDIAMQLVEDELNHDVTIFMGGGRQMFVPNTTADVEYPDELGWREDGRFLAEEWIDNMRAMGFDEEEAVFLIDQEGFDNIDIEKAQRVLGLFNPEHMAYECDRAEDPLGEPSLAQMVEKSIQILSKNENGYMLLAEGGRIDHGHHATNAYRALDDTLALSDAVSVAMAMTDPEDTLLLVTADHSHVMSISGSPGISESIFGYDDSQQIADDGMPFQTLSYANGPGYYVHRTSNDSVESEQRRLNLSEVSKEAFEDKNWVQDAAVPLDSETHAGEEVAIYARGPMAALIHGTHQQSYVAHVILYATCIEGSGSMPHCEEQQTGDGTSIHQVARRVANLVTVLAILVLYKLK